ncbi:urease accessory protein UreF [Azospira restricta]|uniref:Urease accessory protein UreF n=1 Tax=Azospira restricta TaxID=404405 RepID=A0A974PY77_9RHOO|nr:urease accessory UreF family protein [Azospira restricta]QRJ63366.1 urease accessory protein UreF [Azospira restricta]
MPHAAALPLARLLQLASPALPVGAYTYSQGLEWAVECGVVRDEATAGRWIGDLLAHGIGRYEAPLVAALMAAWSHGDRREIARLNAEFIASREAAELRAETVQMGFSMRRLLADLRDDALAPHGEALAALDEVAFPTAWAGIAAAWGIAVDAAVTAYLWSWAENQAMAALKAVPLGQAAGQRLLAALGAELPRIAAAAIALPEARWSNFAPAFAIACARHETQYSRLFRS